MAENRDWGDNGMACTGRKWIERSRKQNGWGGGVRLKLPSEWREEEIEWLFSSRCSTVYESVRQC